MKTMLNPVLALLLLVMAGGCSSLDRGGSSNSIPRINGYIDAGVGGCL